MRALFSACLVFIFISGFSQNLLYDIQDTLGGSRNNGTTAELNYRMLPSFADYGKNYSILSNFNDDYGNIEKNYSLQQFISEKGYKDSSLINSFSFSNQFFSGGGNTSFNEKEIIYGAWRTRLTQSASTEEIRSAMIEGTKTMISLGYEDFRYDFLPFITGLMEEQHIVNYDNSRTKAFGAGSRGIVTSLQILNALGSLDTEQNYGVCRDVHEAGRELLKTMAETWYGHFHPEKKIDFNKYIFLQSWVTNKSHHVTVSFIDPADTKKIYELDWGRVIERNNLPGYDNGRLCGNTYRIWKYDEKKQVSVPVDFRRTRFGKILDEYLLTPREYGRFNGIFDPEFFSDIRYSPGQKKYGSIDFSVGGYNPGQRFLYAGWHLGTGKRKISGFLTHSGLYAIQGAIHEDTRKKELLYPQNDWQLAASIIGIPRIISKFETKQFRIARDLSVGAWMYQQFDIFLIGNSFYVNDSSDRNDLSGSGDGNLSFSNGFSFLYSSGKGIEASAGIQARSTLLAKDIRLFTPNVFTLIPSLRFITPSIDAMASALLRFNEHGTMVLDGMLEFTSMGGVVFSGTNTIKYSFTGDLFMRLSYGMTDNIKGLDYFWYPVSRRWIELGLSQNRNSMSLSFLKYPESNLTCNVSFRRYLNL